MTKQTRAIAGGQGRWTGIWTAAAVLLGGMAAQAGEIRWRSGAVQLAERSAAEVAAAMDAAALVQDVRHAVVQFSAPVDDTVRARLAGGGVTLLGYLSDNAFFARLDAAGVDVAQLAGVETLASFAAIDPAWKLHPMYAAGEIPAYAVVRDDATGDERAAAYVMFHADVSLADGRAAVAAHGGLIRDELETVNALVIELPAADIAGLATEDVVSWIEPPLPMLSPVNLENRALVQANEVQAAPYNLDGTGVNVLVFDAGTARATHQDFGGRLFVRDGSGLITHATHVSATVAGSGAASGGTQRGMAPGVTIQSYGFQWNGTGIFLYSNPGDIESDYSAAINTFGVDIANNSIGSNTETNGFPCSIQGDYGVTDALIDNIVRGSLGGGPFRIIWAAGNERQGSSCDVEGFGDYYSTAPPAGAKNHITVGATNANDDSMTSFSSWGPTDDGRMKPDICAPGCQSNGDGGVTSASGGSDTGYTVLCGTSMASPTCCGICALLLEDYRAQFPGELDPRNSTLKALLAQNAMDRGNVGPDYQFGYGSVRIKDTIDFMRLADFEEDEVSQGGSIEYTIDVPPGAPELKVTLAWDDPAATPNVIPSLVNDLDLVVLDPSSVQRFPWTLNPANPGAAAVQTQKNSRDNIEQVRVLNPAAGQWTVRVVGFNVPQGPQPYSVCAKPNLTGEPEVRILLPDGVPAVLTPGLSANVAVRVIPDGQNLVPGSAKLHFRYAGGAYQELALTPAGGNDYTATLPPPVCGATPEFYFSAMGDVTGETTNPSDAPAAVYSALVGADVVLADETFEGGANGWVGGQPGDTATTGVWVQVDPVGTSAQPEDDHTPNPGVKCWVTGQGVPGGGLGDNDVDGGFTTLMSPTFNLSGSPNAKISYWRWYSNDTGATPNTDVFPIDISNNNGSTWVDVETVGPSGTGTGGGWIYHEFVVSSLIAPTAQMKLRFIAQDLGDGSLIEAGIDDFRIASFECTAALDDCNGNGIVDADDIASGRSADANGNGVPDECEPPPACGTCDGDLTGDHRIDGDDVPPFVAALLGGPFEACADFNEDSAIDGVDAAAMIDELINDADPACP